LEPLDWRATGATLVICPHLRSHFPLHHSQ
jgi:hypothetical protein